MENLLTAGKDDGRRARGRQRLTFMNSTLSERMEGKKPLEEMIHASNDGNRRKYRYMVANASEEEDAKLLRCFSQTSPKLEDVILVVHTATADF